MANSSGKSRNSKSNGRRVGMILAAFIACALAAPEARAAYTTIVPSDLVNLTGTGTASTTGDIYNNEGPATAFDGKTGATRVIWNQKANIDLVYEFPSPTRVNAFRIWRSSQHERHPKTFRFEGLDDAGEWQKLDEDENLDKDIDWKPVSYRYYQFANTEHFTKYRLFIEANCGNQYTEFFELEMFCVDDGTPTIATRSISVHSATSLDVSVTMGAYAAETVVVKAIDASGAVAASADLGAMSAGAAASGTISGLTTGSTYLLRVDSGAGGLADHAPIGTFYTGTFTLSDVVNAKEAGCVPGSVTVSREAADPFPLTVNYSFVSDDAVEGVDYEAPLGSVVIPAGSISSEVYVKPILNMQQGADVTIAVALASGDYVLVGNESAQVTIVNAVIPSDRNVWIAGASSDGLASTADNWSLRRAPNSEDDVLFDGRFSTANCEWDAAATHTVASWSQMNDYSGVITLKTVYPGKGDFQCLTVTGEMAIHSGTITHPQSRTQGQSATDYLQDLLDNETYRVRIDAGSIVVGPDGRIDARNKGYYHSNSGNYTSPLPSHGGWFGVSGLAPYDNIKEPIHIGMPYKRDSGTYTVGIGGGAVYLTSPGTIVVNGYIGADTGSDTWNRGYTLRGGAAAGSVYVRAAYVTGTGTISASALKTDEQNYRGVGGRVAVISTSSAPVDYTTLHLQTTVYPFKNNNGQSTTYGSCGTVFVKDATQTYGTLLLQNVDVSFSPTIARCTPVTAEGDWTFDAIGLGNRAVLSVPVGTELHLQGGLDSVFSLNAAGSTAYGSIRYEGGTLDFGSAANQTMSGNWMLTGWTNLTLNANVVVKDEAAIGVPAMADILDDDTPGENAKLPDFVSCNLTVTGNLTVESDGFLLAQQCGLKKYKNSLNSGFRGVLPGHTHGGRCLSYKGVDAQLRFYTGYDSVFAPCLPGNSVPWPNGQVAEASGGVIRLVVTGALTLDGEANANGMLEAYAAGGNCSGGTGGAINITAGTLSGAGRIVAEAGSKQEKRGSGGRIAIKLTSPGADFSGFSGTISASGRVLGSGGPADSSAGTVYLQTAADGEKGGTVYIAMSAGNQAANNTNTTEMVSLGYGGDAVDDYKKVKYVVRDYGRAAVNADMKAASIEIADANSSLDLEGHTLTVKSAKINGVKLAPGTYTAESTVVIGEGSLGDYLVDTVTGGELIVDGVGLSIIVR